MPETFDSWNHALAGEDPLVELVELAKQRVAEGAERQHLVEELERFREVLQADDREADEDLVLELMDFLTGFCSPHLRI